MRTLLVADSAARDVNYNYIRLGDLYW